MWNYCDWQYIIAIIKEGSKKIILYTYKLKLNIEKWNKHGTYKLPYNTSRYHQSGLIQNSIKLETF
jgi:hypothetical protein